MTLTNLQRARYPQPPRLCDRCGFLMAVCEPMVAGEGPPYDGCLSLCDQCGLPFVMAAGAWRPLQPDERAALPAPVRAVLEDDECALYTAYVISLLPPEARVEH